MGLLGAVLLWLFAKSLETHQILFANDRPLGSLSAACNQLPSRLSGTWGDTTWLGGEGPTASPSITILLSTLLSPVAFLKIYAPITLLFLGFSAWLFFRQLNFSPIVCVLGGVAAGLNAHFFSIACWGLGNWCISAGCTFLAMAALCAKSIPKIWEKAVLAGLAVGMGVMEGYDVGAILSVFIGIFIIFRILTDDAPIARRVANAAVAETLVVFFAAVIAFHTMKTLVQTQVEGVAAMEQDVQTKQTRWNSATQWSMPKLETLQVFVPGLFGYRLSGNIDHRDHSGAYWGLIGQDPRVAALGSADPIVRSNVVSSLIVRSNDSSTLKWAETNLANLDTPDRYSRTKGMLAFTTKTGIYWRYSGSGECAGVIVSLLAVFGLANFFRKDRPYSKGERAAVGYWGVVALFSVLASWGRFGFVYQLLYRIPYVSTIRNPIKFMNPFHIAWIILAAYGMEVLYRRYLRGQERTAKLPGFDRKWNISMLVLIGVSVTGAVLLYHYKNDFVRYLESQNFPNDYAQPMAKQMANFCLQRVGAFIGVLAAGAIALAIIISGGWTGTRSKWAWGALAALIICDLARADIPWVHYFDYIEKYQENPVVNFLLDKPWEHRAIGKLEPRGPGSGIQGRFAHLYFFWLQNDFPYHNIQSLDFSQAAHMPDLDRDYLKAFELTGADIASTDLRLAARLWQLTNTRYILGSSGAVDYFNQRADPIHHGFKLPVLFSMVPKPGVASLGDYGDYTVQTGAKGEFGVVEYTRALPRAKLYSNWRTPTNDAATLETLANPDFEPWDTLLLATNSPVPQTASSSTADPGTVAITDYHPKDVHLEANAKTPSILLFNDRFNPDWRARVDGTLAPIMRCNYIMRGVYLTPGHHTVEFQFKPSLNSLYVSLSAIVVGIILAGYLILTRAPVPTAATPEAPVPASYSRPPTTPAARAAPSRPPAAPGPQARPPTAANPQKSQKGNGKAKGRK
ncbi:MAG TPA: hypothetical protein VGR14_23240 [Verrucomicrobiae bacterium]|nr:hypothetical protein [Verrucomicrobiae bacterium]